MKEILYAICAFYVFVFFCFACYALGVVWRNLVVWWRRPKGAEITIFAGEHDQKVLVRYNDFTVCGEWGGVDATTGQEIPVGGRMFERTIKFVDSDGKVKLGHEWVPDSEVPPDLHPE